MQSSESRLIDQAIFRKSSYSQSEAACVEVSDLDDATAMRDSKHPEIGFLAFPVREWDAFIREVRKSD
ncbi:DUF397 domain-containing protein [Streptomonospora nanhaiensis]|uniref:DUF397 domain-containing protein n=1 Tax=Streptomonospora nanhaiensis TaxID=1323731 RepID=A0ABY6YHH0_9ACTN|nr:DUF397 domain-containing protein [Streptomonospora nanhaiensis]WAE71712.1 DUF397 domain-containing protein [Streptomonospora nanhaiensis]